MTQDNNSNIELSEAEQLNFSEPSFEDGFNFFFKDGSDIIRASCSVWIRKETIDINGEMKSKTQEFGNMATRHSIVHGGHEYEVNFYQVGKMLGGLECFVLKDGYLIGREVKVFMKSKRWWRGGLKVIYVSCGCGAILGTLLAIVRKTFE